MEQRTSALADQGRQETRKEKLRLEGVGARCSGGIAT
jgi:hypothetical protein